MDRPSIADLVRALRAAPCLLRREWRGVALSCAILAVHLAGAAHRAFERHVLCADHGQWTHEVACASDLVPSQPALDADPCVAAHVAAGAPDHCGPATPGDAADAELDASQGWPADEHHHCLLVSMARVEGVPPLEPCLHASRALDALAPVARRLDFVHRSVLILHLAPKQSPPAA
jgi:hypothetical protein